MVGHLDPDLDVRTLTDSDSAIAHVLQEDHVDELAVAQVLQEDQVNKLAVDVNEADRNEATMVDEADVAMAVEEVEDG